MESFGVDRAQLLKEETTSRMKQVKLQNELLQSKVKVRLLTQRVSRSCGTAFNRFAVSFWTKKLNVYGTETQG